MNIRSAQVASTIRRTVQGVMARGLNDPRVTGLVSVTRVHVTDDLTEASVFLSVMPEEVSALTMHGIRHAAGHIQSHIGRALGMRRVPKLSFRLDESIKKQTRLEEAFARVRAERASTAESEVEPARHPAPEDAT